MKISNFIELGIFNNICVESDPSYNKYKKERRCKISSIYQFLHFL